MTVYKYTSVDKNGRTKKGMLEADSAHEIRHQLKSMDLTPIEIFVIRKKTNPKYTILDTSKLRPATVND